MIADIFYWSLYGLFNRKGQREGAFTQQSVLIGADSVKIVATLSLLIGFILALQAAAQLRQFGANIYIADLVGISITAEMGPLITAIILAGRTGSAIAAEIAKENNILDAVHIAKAYLTTALRAGINLSIGNGHGPVNHSLGSVVDIDLSLIKVQ